MFLIYLKQKKQNQNSVNDYNVLVNFVIVYYFLILRLLSFTLDKIDSPIDPTYSLTNLLNYTLYPSFADVSAFVPFKNFIQCVSNIE